MQIISLRHITEDNICPNCRCGVETELHALWNCKFTKGVWKKVDFLCYWRKGKFASFRELCFNVLETLSEFYREHFAHLC